MSGWKYLWHVLTGHEWTEWKTIEGTQGSHFEYQRRTCKICGASDMRKAKCSI